MSTKKGTKKEVEVKEPVEVKKVEAPKKEEPKKVEEEPKKIVKKPIIKEVKAEVIEEKIVIEPKKIGNDTIITEQDTTLNGREYKKIFTATGLTFLLSPKDYKEQVK